MKTTVAELVATLSADTSAFTSGLASAATAVDGFATNASSKLQAAGSTMRSVGKTATVGLTLPIVGAGALAVHAFGDFQDSLNTFGAVSRATATQMKAVGDAATKLGNDISLPGTSAADAAATMTELAKAGFTVQESMDAARGVLQLSAAAGIGNAEAATIAANALNAFGLKATDVTRVNDLLAGSANASSAEMTDVAYAMQMAATVFASAGIPIEDLTTSIGLMANAGIKGSDAGTSLKSALMHLQNPSTKAARVMDDLGFRVYDAKGNMKSMDRIIGELSKSTKGLTQEQRDQALATIFGSDGIRAANVLLAAGTTGFDSMRDAVMKEGQAAEVAAAKNKGINGTLDALKSSLETLSIAIGSIIVPALADVANWVSKAASAFQGLSPDVQKAIVIALALVAALGPILTIVGNLTIAIGFLVSPVGLVIVAIAALAAGLIYAYTHCETFRNAVDAVARFLTGTVWPAIQAFAQGVDQVFGDLVDWVRTHWAAIQEAITHVVNVTSDVVGAALAVIQTVWHVVGDDLLNFATAVWGTIQGVVEGALAIISGIIETTLAIINGDWGAAWDGIKTILSGAWEIIKSTVQSGIDAVQAIIGGVMSPINAAWETAWNTAKSVLETVWKSIKTAVETAINEVKTIIDGLVTFVTGVPARIKTEMGDVFGFLKDAATDAKTWISDRMDDIVTAIKAIPGKLGDIGRQIIDKITPDFSGIDLLPGIDVPGIPFAAAGGSVGPGPVIVGEKGPELFVPGRSGFVVPNHRLGAMATTGGSGSGSSTYNTYVTVNVDGTVVSERQLIDVVYEGLKQKERHRGTLAFR